MMLIGMTVIQCDGHLGTDWEAEDADRCEATLIYDNETWPEIRQDLMGRAWTIWFNRQFCDIHGHQAPKSNRKEIHGNKVSNEAQGP